MFQPSLSVLYHQCKPKTICFLNSFFFYLNCIQDTTLSLWNLSMISNTEPDNIYSKQFNYHNSRNDYHIFIKAVYICQCMQQPWIHHTCKACSYQTVLPSSLSFIFSHVDIILNNKQCKIKYKYNNKLHIYNSSYISVYLPWLNFMIIKYASYNCLLYTSDAADD